MHCPSRGDAFVSSLFFFCHAPSPELVDSAKFDLNRCNESPLRGEKPDFWRAVSQQ